MIRLIIVAIVASSRFAGPAYQTFTMPLTFPSHAICEAFRTSEDFESAVTDLRNEMRVPVEITAECK